MQADRTREAQQPDGERPLRTRARPGVMAAPDSLLAFALDALRFALPLASVERVMHAVAITPLPNAPEVILGVINMGGRLVPVADIRKRFRLPARDIALGGPIVIAHTPSRALTRMADAVHGVMQGPILYVRGIAKHRMAWYRSTTGPLAGVVLVAPERAPCGQLCPIQSHPSPLPN